MTGIRTHIVRRLDGKGYDIRKRKIHIFPPSNEAEIIILVGHYTVRPGHLVYINDTSLFHSDSDHEAAIHRDPDVQLRFYINPVDPMFEIQTGMQGKIGTSNDFHALITGHTGNFGGDVSKDTAPNRKLLRFVREQGLTVNMDYSNSRGCKTYERPYPDAVLLVHRGDCTFLEKLLNARTALAAGVLVIGDDDTIINPTANADELEAAGDLNDVVIVVLPKKGGQMLLEMMANAENGGAQVTMAMDREERLTPDTGHVPEETVKDPHRILYLNGHPLLNTRLLI